MRLEEVTGDLGQSKRPCDLTRKSEKGKQSPYSNTRGGGGYEAVAVTLWNASWHLEQGKEAQQSSETGELNKEAQGGRIRSPAEPHRTIQTRRSKVIPVIFPNESCTW